LIKTVKYKEQEGMTYKAILHAIARKSNHTPAETETIIREAIDEGYANQSHIPTPEEFIMDVMAHRQEYLSMCGEDSEV